MATPHVAAAAALVIANGDASTPDEVRAQLESTADDLGASGRDNVYGHGFLNLEEALGGGAPIVPTDAPPAVSITSHASGTIISGGVTFKANASDDNGVTKVEFFVDGSLAGTDTSSPYETGWNSLSVGDGVHALTAKAYDTIGQTSIAIIAVIVDNVNDAPVADAGDDQTLTDTDNNGSEAVTRDGSGSYDSDGTIASYAWRKDGTLVSTAVSFSQSVPLGDTTYVLTVTDNDGATSTDSVLVRIVPAPSEIEVFNESFEGGLGQFVNDSQADWYVTTQRARNGSRSAEVDGRARDSALTSVPIELSGKTNARIGFSWFIENGFDSGEYIAFDVSKDGGATWDEYGRLRGNVDQENVWHDESIDVAGVSSLRLRFRGTVSGSSEDADVDTVVVTGY